ncbi:MAG: nitrilase-related carbon-nitrogen hydrolase [Pseudomonadota bacterium]|nr:nitrilase-related carbon-nitrogen hydrolase [Pseudomonadota bacterium]
MTIHRTLTDRFSTRALLLIGGVLIVACAYRWAIPALTWVALVPWLVVARRLRGARGWLGLLAVVTLAVHLQITKIITPPVPLMMVLGFAPPMALGIWAVLAASEWLRRRTGEAAGVAAFVGLTIVSEWLTYAHSPMGMWGTAASMLADDLLLLQLTALTGIAGIGALVALSNALLAWALTRPRPRMALRPLLGMAALLLLVYGWGAVRVLQPSPGDVLRVAAITTSMGLDGGLPAPEALAANTRALLARTRTAAEQGARFIVWNEAATVVLPGDEAALLAEGAELARAQGVELVLAYAAIVSREPLMLDNKYVWFGADGQPIETYRKHHPVPGEPSLTGDEPLRVHPRPWGRAAGAICYDYDFPALGRAHARQGAALVALPASDWLGIQPLHTRMARIRAIEGGFALVRATRWGESAVFDAHGRLRASMPGHEPHGHLLHASVPVRQVPTLYTRWGDLPMLALAGGLLAWVAWRWRRAAAKTAPA